MSIPTSFQLRGLSKQHVRDALRDALTLSLQQMASFAEDARQGAVHEEARSEGDKDMRATEQSYVARGQAMRTQQLANELARLEATPCRVFELGTPISAGALVHVQVDQQSRVLFFVAQGGGRELDVDGVRITVVTPSSPVGQQLFGREVGDQFEVTAGDTTRTWEVLEIA